MQTFQTSDRVEMRRAKQAQFIGYSTDLRLNGATFHGVVLAVMPHPDGTTWTVRFEPKARQTAVKPPRHRYTY